VATYSRAGQFGPAAISGAPAGVALRVLDTAGSDAVLWSTADRNKTVGPIVYSNSAGQVSFFADPATYTVAWTGGSTTVTVTGGTEDQTAAGSQASLTSIFDLVTVGEEVMPRETVASEYALDTGTAFFTYFTARKSEPITQVSTAVYGIAAATLSRARVGIYQASGGTLSLVAATANDTSMWTATFTTYPKALSATWNKVAGNRYAFCVLAVGTTMPVLGCQQNRYQDVARAPRIQGELAGQTDLPASVSEAGLANGYRRFQGMLLP
jgi:hypothetical protein